MLKNKTIEGLLFLMLLVLAGTDSFAVTYTTTGSGDWDDCGIWAPGCPPSDPIPDGDSVAVLHAVIMTDNIDIDGVLYVSAAGSLTGTDKITTSTTGTLRNDGTITTTDQIHNDGSVYNNGYMRIKKMHDDGYTCNTGTIELDSGEKYDCHGCILECGGDLIACEFKMHENGGTNPDVSNINVCCDDGTDPSFDIAEGDTSLFSICGSIPLPIDLLFFDAELEQEQVILTWATITETDNDYFRLFKSPDGINYEEFRVINGAENSLQMINYSSIDLNPYFGFTYYKLSQVDMNGEEEEFDPKSVFLESFEVVSIYPNPAVDNMNIIISAELEIEGTIQIFNLTGQVVFEKYLSLVPGINTINFNVDDYANGFYMFRVITPYGTQENKEFVVK